MKRDQLPLYAIAGAILIVGLSYAGVSVATLLPALILLACPLMMIFMMKGMHGGEQQGGPMHETRDEERHHTHPTGM